VLVIVAAGNDGKEIADVAPAGLAGVMTVAATNENDARAPFSNHGDGISIAAPGTHLLSLRARRTDFQLGRLDEYAAGAAFVGRDRRYYRSSGTSFAAPIVAGVAALVWSKTPTLTAVEVRQRLEQTARDVEVPGRDLYTGFGIVDARAALASDASASIVAEIDHANPVKDAGAVWIEVTGSASATPFGRAWLELGVGESPSSWKKVGAELTSAVAKGALGRIPASAFAGAKVWTVRLVVQSEDGKTREVRYLLQLG
jgi:subtilisin family serine protease